MSCFTAHRVTRTSRLGVPEMSAIPSAPILRISGRAPLALACAGGYSLGSACGRRGELNTTVSDYERKSWPNSTQFLNYLAAEIAVAINLVGLWWSYYHRSGAYGTLQRCGGGSNGYLIGDTAYDSPQPRSRRTTTVGAPDPNRSARQRRLPLEEQLRRWSLMTSAQQAPTPLHLSPQESSEVVSASGNCASAAVTAAIDQRVSDVTPREGLGISTSLDPVILIV